MEIIFHENNLSFSVFIWQPLHEVHHHRHVCTVWVINRHINRREQFRKRRHRQSFHVRWSIRVKQVQHVQIMFITQ